MKIYSITYAEPAREGSLNLFDDGYELEAFDDYAKARKAWEGVDPYKTSGCGWRDDCAIVEYCFSAYDDETGEIDYSQDEIKVLAWFNEKKFGIDERDICFDFGLDENDESDKEMLESIIEERKEKVERLRKKYHITEDNLDY